jgi:hypothetical protein
MPQTFAGLGVFVRKHAPEIQHLRTSISEEQRLEFGRLVAKTIDRIKSGDFSPHSGIRFPQNACVSCSHLGLCLSNEQLVAANLIRNVGPSDPDGLTSLWIDGRLTGSPALDRRRAVFVLGKIDEILTWVT